jgi:hypothetical protein
VREVKCTHIGYGTRLNRVHTLDPISIAFSSSSHPVTPDAEQENNQETLDKSQVPQTDSSTTELHNLNQRGDKEKVTDHMRVKICKNRHKTETQFY